VAGNVVADSVVAGSVVEGNVVAGNVVAGSVVAGNVVAGSVVAGNVVVGNVVAGVSVNADLRFINLKSIIIKNRITMIRNRIYSLSFHDVYNQLKTILEVLSVILL